MGVIGILAQVLELDDTDRMTLRSWYERHMAPYLVLALDERDGEVRTMRTENLVNEQEYLIRLGRPRCPFRIGNVVLGSLVPWRGERPLLSEAVRRRVIHEWRRLTVCFLPNGVAAVS